jgi:hypothetical protein
MVAVGIDRTGGVNVGARWRRGVLERKLDDEGRPLPAAGTLDGDAAAMRLDQVLHDREAESKAAVEMD